MSTRQNPAKLVMLAVAGFLCLGLCAPFALCQDEPPGQGKGDDGIARRQEEVERELRRLEELLLDIAKRIEEREPESAKKLREAWKATREKLIPEDMELVRKALHDKELLKAYGKAGEVVKKLIEILNLLAGRKPQDKPEDAPDGQRERFEQVIEKLKRMLELQKEINRTTRELDAKKTEEELLREDRIELRKMSRLETRLYKEALELARQLEEENVFVFADVLKETAADMKEVADLLEREDTGRYTQHLEKEIVKNLKWLIEALEEKVREPGDNPPPQPPGEPQPPGDPPPPVLPVAELRLLRRLEADIHEKTKAIHDALKGRGPNFFQKKMINRLAHKQARLTDITKRLRESLRR